MKTERAKFGNTKRWQHEIPQRRQRHTFERQLGILVGGKHYIGEESPWKEFRRKWKTDGNGQDSDEVNGKDLSQNTSLITEVMAKIGLGTVLSMAV